MLKKILILSMIITSLIICTTSTVSAKDETKSFADAVGDVVDISQETVSDVHDVDIIKVVYNKVDQDATIDIEFGEDIDESSTLSLLVALEMTNVMQYAIVYEEGYAIGYAADLESDINNLDDFELDVTTSINGATLSFSFLLKDEDEEYNQLMITAENAEGYGDTFPNFDIPVSIDGPETGTIKKEIQFTSTVEGDYETLYYIWDFNEDTIPDSTEANPKFIFNTPGTYNVMLTVDLGNNITYGFDNKTIVISSGSGGGGNNSNGTPGFEIIAVISAIAIAVIILKRKK